MKLKKINNQGFSHLIAIALVLVVTAVVGTYMIVRSDARTPCVKRSFGIGSRGNCVKVIQKAVRTKADGKYGPKTAVKVKSLQKQKHLKADGVVGPRTWHPICATLLHANGDTKAYDYAGCGLKF